MVACFGSWVYMYVYIVMSKVDKLCVKIIIKVCYVCDCYIFILLCKYHDI